MEQYEAFASREIEELVYVACLAQTLLVAHITNARIGGQRLECIRHSVAARIVRNQDFDVRISLIEARSNRLLQEIGSFPGRDADRNERRHVQPRQLEKILGVLPSCFFEQPIEGSFRKDA